MPKKYPIDKSFGIFAKFSPPFGRCAFALARAALPCMPKGLRGGTEVVKIRRGGVRGLLISPKGVLGELPCLILIHGGGFAFGAAPYHYRNAGAYAVGARCRVFVVDYRLAPRNAYPVPAEDCLAAYRLICGHAAEYGTDVKKIAVCGDSAGGCLAAETIRRAAEEGLPAPCFAMLVYPVLDARMQTPSMQAFSDTPIWNARLTKKMWRFYLQGRSYRSPAAWDDLRMFPPTYLETAEFDCLRDEGAAFAKRLQDSGIPVLLNETRGTMHGYDIVRRSPITQENLAKRIAALRAAFAHEGK